MQKIIGPIEIFFFKKKNKLRIINVSVLMAELVDKYRRRQPT
jgi:uncharacterized protein YfkK (UPF0435 family)